MFIFELWYGLVRNFSAILCLCDERCLRDCMKPSRAWVRCVTTKGIVGFHDNHRGPHGPWQVLLSLKSSDNLIILGIGLFLDKQLELIGLSFFILSYLDQANTFEIFSTFFIGWRLNWNWKFALVFKYQLFIELANLRTWFFLMYL